MEQKVSIKASNLRVYSRKQNGFEQRKVEGNIAPLERCNTICLLHWDTALLQN
jgi:hypothetical protein